MARGKSEHRQPTRRASDRPLRAGARLGKYRIQRKLGEGGFAVVYRALDSIEGVPVAVKAPRAHLLSPDSLRLFRKEARLHAGLDHPSILPIKSAEIVDGQFIVVYPAGLCSLGERMRRRMSIDTFLTLAEQMLDAVAYAHRQRVIHCDLKPENFILFPDNRLRLCDFSIAKISVRTVFGSGSGTVGYVAPEQAMGRASFRSDVFALGLLLWEMLAGELPEWPFAWPLPGHDRLRRKVPPDFVAFLRRALDLDPRRRFADAGQMLAAFVRLKPRLRRFSGKVRRRRAPANGRSTAPDWRQVRYRSFQRAHRRDLGLNRACSGCEGPVSELMAGCPWCGRRLRLADEPISFPARCPRCKRGRKQDWRFCAWCYGPGFKQVADREYADRRYQGRCHNAGCRGPLMPFMRYCPWCRNRVKQPWKIPGIRDRCGKCGWGVVREHWEHCPWCIHRLK